MNKNVLILLPLLFITGCATQRYTWHGYDDHLYAYYKDPATRDKFIEHLKETILKGEKNNNVPPGIYAEYGYMLYEKQDYSDSIIYFQKEHDLWPESRYFMKKMIDNAQKMLSKNKPQGTD
jgi:hypothetical protein